MRRSRTRDVATCALQMWAYVAAYKTPHDDVHAQQAFYQQRVRKMVYDHLAKEQVAVSAVKTGGELGSGVDAMSDLALLASSTITVA